MRYLFMWPVCDFINRSLKYYVLECNTEDYRVEYINWYNNRIIPVRITQFKNIIKLINTYILRLQLQL